MATVVATYCFVSPFPTKETVELINRAFLRVGKVKKVNDARGYLLCKYRLNFFDHVKTEFFVERSDESCKVRALFYTMANDKWWDNFLKALFTEAPGVDFGVTLANGEPYIVGILYLGGDTEQVYTSRTKGGSSLLGFLAGDLMFGPAGAVVGGMSRKRRTVTHNFTQFSDSQLARLLYNNGKLWEGTIKKGSKLYNEIMVNIK